MSVSSFMGYLKGKSSLMIYEKYPELKFAAQMVDADDKHKVHDEIERRIRTKEHQDAVIQHQTELMRIAVYISAFLQHGAVAEPERLCGIED